MSDLSIAIVGSTAKPTYPLFAPAGSVAASVSALDSYFQALDQTPVPSPGRSSTSGQRSDQNPGSGVSQAANPPASLPGPSSNFGGSRSASGPASPYASAGSGKATSGKATSSGGSGRSVGLVDTYG